jgi:hypothetical protein
MAQPISPPTQGTHAGGGGTISRAIDANLNGPDRLKITGGVSTKCAAKSAVWGSQRQLRIARRRHVAPARTLC